MKYLKSHLISATLSDGQTKVITPHPNPITQYHDHANYPYSSKEQSIYSSIRHKPVRGYNPSHLSLQCIANLISKHIVYSYSNNSGERVKKPCQRQIAMQSANPPPSLGTHPDAILIKKENPEDIQATRTNNIR
jgi:hypothetical protein